MNVKSLSEILSGKIFRPEIIFFSVFLIIGLSIYDDYGISFDEDEQRLDIGYVNYNFITRADTVSLPVSDGKYHGPAFEIFLVFIEKLFKLSDTRSIYLARHLCTFLLFFVACIFFYLIARQYFQSRNTALLSVAFLVLSPRIFAEAFYNCKDLALLSVFIISIYTMIRYLQKQNFINALLHALACALLIDIRITGLIIPALTLMILLTDTAINWIGRKKHMQSAMNFCLSLVYFILTCGLIILFWPVLWLNPVFHFTEAFIELSHYPWKNEVLYLGEKIQATMLPWHYIPVWIIVTTPVVYILFFISGLFFLLRTIFQNPLNFFINSKSELIILASFFVPLVSIMIFHSTVYDGWRHLYFIYPSLLLISAIGFVELKKIFTARKKYLFNRIMIAAVGASLFYTAITMTITHPFQNVYFNVLAGNPAGKFELDYWGLTFRKGLEYILRTDSSKSIIVTSEDIAVENNIQILLPKDRERISYTDCFELADYYLDNFRWKGMMKDSAERIFSVKTFDATIMSVYIGPRKRTPAKNLMSFKNDFEKNYPSWNNGTTTIKDAAHSGVRVNEIDSTNLFSGEFTVSCDSLKRDRKNIICRASVWKYSADMNDNSVFVISISNQKTGQNYFWYGRKVRQTSISKAVRWKNIMFAAKLPEHIPAEHVLKVYVWNPGKAYFYLDDFYVEVLEQNKNN